MKWEMKYIQVRPKRLYKDLIDEEKYELAQKLQMSYEGPYTVIERISPVLYVVKMDDEKPF